MPASKKTAKKAAVKKKAPISQDAIKSKMTRKAVAGKAKAQGVELVVFDRGGYQYHGRIKALADAAREAGLGF